MKDIEFLRQFREGLPSPRDERREAARAALLERIEASSRSASRNPAPVWRSRRIQLAVAGVGVAALLVALPVAIFGGSGKVESAAAQALNEVAGVAAAQEPTRPPRLGEYLYTRSRQAYLTTTVLGGITWNVLEPEEEEFWIAPDGSGRQRSRNGEPTFLSASARAAWVKAGSPLLPQAGETGDTRFKPGGLSYRDFSGLPTDSKELRGWIEERRLPWFDGPAGEAETFVLLGDMLRKNYLSPDLRAAAFEVAAELPNIQLLGRLDDPVGRPGIGVAFADRQRGTRTELIFDPADSALLAEREVLIAKGLGPKGTVVGYAVYLESAVVDSTNTRPPRK
jgi:hypothetical protein